MSRKVEEIQDYLRAQGIKASETAIVDAAIRIATRWGGNAVFICELKGKEKGDKN
jgi:hypothetical protein